MGASHDFGIFIALLLFLISMFETKRLRPVSLSHATF